jgi:hypothetical protein
MKRIVLALVLLPVLLLGSSKAAERGPQKAAPGVQPPMMGGMAAPETTGMPMMGMMCPMMMGRGMGMGSMMGMMGGGHADPKTMAQMLQLRGEVLKAVGEVLIRHGKAMGEGR